MADWLLLSHMCCRHARGMWPSRMLVLACMCIGSGSCSSEGVNYCAWSCGSFLLIEGVTSVMECIRDEVHAAIVPYLEVGAHDQLVMPGVVLL